MKYEKEKKIVTVTKKGRAVLDEHLPDDVKSRYHVLGKVSEILLCGADVIFWLFPRWIIVFYDYLFPGPGYGYL